MVGVSFPCVLSSSLLFDSTTLKHFVAFFFCCLCSGCVLFGGVCRRDLNRGAGKDMNGKKVSVYVRSYGVSCQFSRACFALLAPFLCRTYLPAQAARSSPFHQTTPPLSSQRPLQHHRIDSAGLFIRLIRASILQYTTEHRAHHVFRTKKNLGSLARLTRRRR